MNLLETDEGSIDNQLEILKYIKTLETLQASCAEMILAASKFKNIHLPIDGYEIRDRNEWGSSKQHLAEVMQNLRRSMDEVCKEFCIPKKPLRIVDMGDGTKKEMWT